MEILKAVALGLGDRSVTSCLLISLLPWLTGPDSGNSSFSSCHRACVECRVDRSSFRSTLLIADLITIVTERSLAYIGLSGINALSHVPMQDVISGVKQTPTVQCKRRQARQ